MTNSFPHRRWFGRAMWPALLLMPLSLIVTDCAPPADNGNANDNQNTNGNTNGNQNDNGNANGNENDNGQTGDPESGQVFVEFDFSTTNTDVARALGSDGTEYGFFGEKDPSGSSFDIEHMDVILPTSAAVRTTFDELDRPSQLLGSDRSALLLSYDHAGDEVTAVFVATDGETNLIVATLNSANSRTGSQASFGVGDLCNLITNLTAVTDSVLASCSEDSEGGLCASSIAQAIGAWEAFCQSELILVINELASSVGRGPALTVPLAVVARTASDSVAPDTGVSLRGDVLGGSPPYRFDWEVLAGSPAQPEIIATDAGSISAATVNLSIEGVYSIQLTVFDSVGQSAFFELVILVSADPDALAVDAGAEISDQDPFQATLSAEASGGVPPFSFVWQLFGGPEDGEVTFDDETAAITTAVFSKCGTFIIEVLATDAIEVSTLFSFPVTIIDVTAGLIVDITFPTCADATMQNTCVLLNESLIFGVDVTTDAGGNGQFEYEWEVIDGSNAAVLDDADTASPTLTAIGPDTLTLQVAVTDTATCQKVTDEIAIEVIQDSDLTVDILSDGNATLNQPETLLANVSGTVGLLSYEWTVTEGTGSFDDDAAQNVLFTPTSRPLVTVQVTVSDDANGNTATATEELSISTFSVTIVGSSQIKRNAVATFAVSLSDGAPSSVNYLWSVDKQDADDSLDVDTVNVTAAELQLLPQGDGVFDLSVLVTEAGDAENFASDSVVVTVFCSEASRPGAETGAAQLALGSDVVTLTCADPDQTSNRSFRWQQLSGTGVALVDADTANAKFTMLPSTLGFAPLVFECIVQNDATLCERSDSTTVYATPIVAPDDGSLDVTALTGSKVELTCVQQFGSTADEYDWRQVDDNGAEIDPPSVTDVAVDSASGVLTFTAPSSAQELFFECQGIVAGPDGDLAGPFSSDDAAMVTVEYFSVAAVVRDGDSAGGSSLADINVDRIRLSGAGPGEVVFSSTLSGGSPSSGVFQADLDTSQTTTLVSEGGNAPNGGSFGLINLFDVDDAGNLSFVARVSGAPAGGENQGVFTLIDGSAAEVAADGAADINPSGQRFCRFDDVAIAGNGTVFFLAQFDGDDNTGSNEHLDCSGTFLEGIYAHSSGVTSAVAESGSTIVPDSIPGVVFGNTFQQLHSNAAGDVIFAGQDAAATAIGAFIDPATGSLDSIFLNNRGAADTDEVYAADLPADLSIRASGVAAFQADLAGDFGEPTQGIFTNVGSLGTAIVLNGSGSPAGLTISSIEQLAMNAAGDVAFIADGRLLYYDAASGAVVEVRDQSGTAVADGEMVSGLTIDGLADVQLSDAGSIVFSATLSGGGTAIFVATPN